MPAPINTYNSLVNLNLGQVPQVEDPALYDALLDVHNAIESLVTGTGDADAAFAAFIAKYRKVRIVDAATLVEATDGTILVDASAATADITVTLPPAGDFPGYRFNIKRVDPAPVSYYVNLVGDGAELIDGKVGGIRVSSGSSYTVQSTDTGWVII